MESASDVVVIGAGLIGLALARELAVRGLAPIVLEQGSAGRGASWAGAGMLAAAQCDAASPLRPLALASAALYPAFVRAVEIESGAEVDYRPCGTELHAAGGAVAFLPDHCVDNRRLVAALAAAVRRRGIPLLENCPVRALAPAAAGGWEIFAADGRHFAARHVVVAAGAWSAALGVAGVRPRKGQMLALAAPPGRLRRILVAPGVYLVPRADGRVLAGATVEDVGFDLTVEPAAIARLRAAAQALLPALAGCPDAEAWAGLRPGSHDDLPYLGPLPGPPGYWAATGHFRDGILLTPVTAQLMADLICGATPRFALAPFAPARYQPL